MTIMLGRLLRLLALLTVSTDAFQVRTPSQRTSWKLPALAEPDGNNVVATAPPTSFRRVDTVEQFARLPVWPAWNGVFIFAVSKLLGVDAAAKLEHAIGGRVCPNFFSNESKVSPFIMLVHHRHSFFPLDPLRWFQNKFILPEGFPAHPHRGFVTLTYILRGGFVHRDSMGIQQRYGGEGQEAHSQWLNTGAGLLHEEMFDGSSDQELYQLWLNLPAAQKMGAPSTMLLGDSATHEATTGNVHGVAPRIIEKYSETIVLAGTFDGVKSDAPCGDGVAVFHVIVQPGGTWTYSDIPASYETMVMYLRRGSATISEETIPVHHTAYLSGRGQTLRVENKSSGDVLDFMLLAGAPLLEPVAAQGSMVMNTGDEINQAMADYQMGLMGAPWDHKLTDEEWKEHVRKYPCRYGRTP